METRKYSLIIRWLVYSLIYWGMALFGYPFFEPHGIVFGFAFMSLGLVMAQIASIKKGLVRMSRLRHFIGLILFLSGYMWMAAMPKLAGFLLLSYMVLAWPVLEDTNV